MLSSSFAPLQNCISACFGDALVKRIVAHHDRGGPATRQALYKFNRELSILRRLWPMAMGIQAQFIAKVLVQLVRAAKGATQGAADFQVIPPYRLLFEHRIKG